MRPVDYQTQLTEITTGLTSATRCIKNAHTEISINDDDYPWSLIDVHLAAAVDTLEAVRVRITDLRKGNQ